MPTQKEILAEALAPCSWPGCELAQLGLTHDVKVAGLPLCTTHAQEAIGILLIGEPKETP